MVKNKSYQVIYTCLFVIFCLAMVSANIGNMLKEPTIRQNRAQASVSAIVVRLNQEAPYQVGTERWFLGAELNGDTLIYKYELRCNDETEKYYFNHEKELRNFSLMSFKMMNAQRDVGTRMVNALKNYHLILKYLTAMPSGKNISYVYTPKDIDQIANNPSFTSEEALMSYVKTMISVASQSLPIVTTESGQPIVVSSYQKPDSLKYIILKSIRLNGKDVVFLYSTPEIKYTVPIAKKGSDDEEDVKAILNELCKDPYFKGQINYFALAKCNLILRYKGARSLQSMDIRFPYTLLRDYSFIPEEQLDKE